MYFSGTYSYFIRCPSMLHLLYRPAQSCVTDLLIEAYVKVAAKICNHAHFGVTLVWQIVILTSHESALYAVTVHVSEPLLFTGHKNGLIGCN